MGDESGARERLLPTALPTRPLAGERLERAYTLLVSSTPALYRSWVASPNERAAHLNAFLHDAVVDWLREYAEAQGLGDLGLTRIADR